MSGVFLLTLLSLLPGAISFKFGVFGSSNRQTHERITETAILNITLHACRAVAEAEDRDFTFPASLTTENVLKACSAEEAAKDYELSKSAIKDENVRVDKKKFLSAERHCDNEKLNEGKKIITDGLDALKASIKRGNLVSARLKLGEILHTLQDFYSHSNWIEMRNDLPNSNLISKENSIGQIADRSRRTCRNCDGNDCTNNILEDILSERILTSGYFSLSPISPKPPGKCSHGDFPDFSALSEPKGGINKDTVSSSHGHLHEEAASVATRATSELLNDVRGAAGDKEFLRMLGIISGKALCFVIDTTGSMGDDIASVRTATTTIIENRLGTKNEPSQYILVPFNDPGFGPLIRTADANTFKKAINELTPTGGGDFAELSLSGLQLALTGSPPGSEIYLFTDASAKDEHLKSTVTALIERTGSVVHFMITSIGGSRRRRNSPEQRAAVRLSASNGQVYKDLAAASGGQAVEVTKSKLLEAINAVVETSKTNVVTIQQAVRDPGRADNFTFLVDETMTDLTLYITGAREDFALISPSGEMQEATATPTNGSLITSKVFVGNLGTLKLKKEVGQWEVRVRSTNPYTVKITAQSLIDILISFVEPTNGPFGGIIGLSNRPKAGTNGTMLVTLIGGSTASLTEVSLLLLSGSGKVQGNISNQDSGKFLVEFETIPSQQFNVLIKGQLGNSSTRSSPEAFQRQSTTSFKASTVDVTTSEERTVLQPGEILPVNFTVSTDGSGGTFNIRATNDQGFSATFPSTLEVPSGSSEVGTVQLTAPNAAESGTEVTLTIEAESPDGDINYSVLSLTVLKEVTDLTRPVCKLLSLRNNCSDLCSNSSWEFSVHLSDGVNGTGIERIDLRQGNGTLNTSLTADNDTLATYTASCCSPTAEIVAVDAVGNVGTCTFSVRAESSTGTTTGAPTIANTTMNATTMNTTASMAPNVMQSSILCVLTPLLALLLK